MELDVETRHVHERQIQIDRVVLCNFSPQSPMNKLLKLFSDYFCFILGFINLGPERPSP